MLASSSDYNRRVVRHFLEESVWVVDPAINIFMKFSYSKSSSFAGFAFLNISQTDIAISASNVTVRESRHDSFWWSWGRCKVLVLDRCSACLFGWARPKCYGFPVALSVTKHLKCYILGLPILLSLMKKWPIEKVDSVPPVYCRCCCRKCRWQKEKLSVLIDCVRHITGLMELLLHSLFFATSNTLRLQDTFWLLTLCLIMFFSLGILSPYWNRFWIVIYCAALLLPLLLLLFLLLL
jgi:hypothetical protein